MILISRDTRTTYIVTTKDTNFINNLLDQGFTLDPRPDNEALKVYLTRNGNPILQCNLNKHNELVQRYNNLFCINCYCYLYTHNEYSLCDLCTDKCS